MSFCKRPLTVLALAASLTVGSFAVAQDSPMPKQQKVPPMTGPQGGITHPEMASGHKDMMGSMEADKTVNMQLMKYATMPEEAGDPKFALMAGCGNMAEVEFSKVVAMKAVDPDVKALAEMMVKEHSMAQEKLMPIGEKLGVTYPKSLPTMKQQELNLLSAMPPEKMEKAYLSMMKSDHLMTVNNYTDHIPMIKDADLKGYATETLAKVRAHTAEVLKVAGAKGMPIDLKFDAMPMDHKM